MALCILNDTTKKLQVVLSGAVSSTELPIVVSYKSHGTPGISYDSKDSITTGGTAVDALGPAPAGRRFEVEGMSIYNADSATATVTVRQYVNASTTRIIIKTAILTAETLLYSESQGWHVVDASGNRKENSNTADSVDISTALSTAESAATRASTALSAATSLDTATDTAYSTGDSTTLSAATSLATRDSTAASTALSTATSAGLAASVVQSNETRQSTDQSTMRSLLNSGGQAGF